jgi:hypothetical protein
MNSRSLLIVALAALSCAAAYTPASAQAPSSSDAQNFIKIVLGQNATKAYVRDVQMRKDMDSGWNCGGSYTCYYTTEREATLYWISAPSQCATVVQPGWIQSSYHYDHAQHSVAETPQITLMWDKIARVSSSGSSISLSWDGRIRTIYAATDEMAGRLSRAMQTLIDSCDPTAGTGF